MAFTGLKWAAGFNNAAGLAFVEDTAPTYMGQGLIFTALPIDTGIVRVGADKLTGTFGFQTIPWTAVAMSRAQYEYIQSTFTVGGNSQAGKMTIRTVVSVDASNVFEYGNYSVVLQLPKQSELELVPGGFLNVRLLYVIEAAL